ncbi:MAG TPA: AraC family transcriptional regulator [Longimicrobium sp.]|nr:AraC family transcriptional regulator [Longimicrobium sp.]
MSLLQASRLFGGSLVSVTDVVCRHHASPRGAEEHAGGHRVIFVRRGVFVMHHQAGRREQVVAEPVHAVLLNDGDPYRVSHPANGGDECTSVEFAAGAVLDVARAFDPAADDSPAAPFAFTRAPMDAEGWLRLRAIRRALLDGASAQELAVEEETLALLARLLRDGYQAHGPRTPLRRAGTARQRRQMVEHAREVLAAAPGRPHTLAEIARQVHGSPFHLTRTFREVLGMPLHQYLLRLRLTLALHRLDQGDQTLSTLALDLGFSSHSHFTTAFRRHFGVTPTQAMRGTVPVTSAHPRIELS